MKSIFKAHLMPISVIIVSLIQAHSSAAPVVLYQQSTHGLFSLHATQPLEATRVNT